MPPLGFQVLLDKIIKQLPNLQQVEINFPCKIVPEVRDHLIQYVKTKTVRNENWKFLLRSQVLLFLHDSKQQTRYEVPPIISLFTGSYLVWTDSVNE